MNPDHVRFADWDAAYILGSLSPSDRALYEAHLAQCEVCRAEIADIAPTLGLLSRVTVDRAQALLISGLSIPTPEPDPARRSNLIEIGEAKAHRRRLWRIGATAAAVAVVIAIAAVPLATILTPAVPEAIVLEQVGTTPLSASVVLADVPWGTRIDMTCRYDKGADAPDDGWGYVLVVISTDGSESELSNWRAYPESTAQLSAGTGLAAAEIDAVEIRTAKTGDVLMRSDPRDFDNK